MPVLCSYPLVLSVSSAVAFPTVSMLTTPSTKSSLSRNSVYVVLCFFFFLLQDALTVFCISAHQMQKYVAFTTDYFFLLRFLCFWERKYLNVKYIIMPMNCLFKGILTVMLGSFLFNMNFMTCNLQGLFIHSFYN